jgi:hypothetical protein
MDHNPLPRPPCSIIDNESSVPSFVPDSYVGSRSVVLREGIEFDFAFAASEWRRKFDRGVTMLNFNVSQPPVTIEITFAGTLR